MHAVDVGEDRGGVGHLVVLALPQDFAGVFVQTDEGLAFAAAGEHEHIAIDERGGGVLPLDHLAAVFLHHVVVPHGFAGRGVEGEDVEEAVDDVNFATVDDRRAAGAVAAFIALGTSVTAAVILRDDAEGLAPDFLAAGSVEAGEHFAGVAIGFASDERVGLAARDGEAAEAQVRGRFPDLVEAPFGIWQCRDGAVARRTTESGPVGGSRGGRGERQTENGGEVGACHGDEKTGTQGWVDSFVGSRREVRSETLEVRCGDESELLTSHLLHLTSTHHSTGLRERGSRVTVSPTPALVTNGPSAIGAVLVNPTSGMSLGRPSRGKSFRSGK